MKYKRTIWLFCCIGAILLTVLAFSPFVIPANQYEPKLAGMPYTLWMGILITVLLVLLTFIGTLVHPGSRD